VKLPKPQYPQPVDIRGLFVYVTCEIGGWDKLQNITHLRCVKIRSLALSKFKKIDRYEIALSINRII